MPNITLLDISLLKHIYGYLNLDDKYQVASVNKGFYNLFYNLPLQNTIFEIDHNGGYREGEFIFNNIVKAIAISKNVELNYLKSFKRMKEIDFVSVQLDSFDQVKAIVFHLSCLAKITVSGNDTKELFLLAESIHSGNFIIWCELSVGNAFPCQRAHRKTRQKGSGSRLIPRLAKARSNNPTLRGASEVEVEVAISKMKELLVNSIVVSQESNWILVTQVETYYHDHSSEWTPVL
ncbi:hypothetical protein BD770DRAFT_406510 [Pilaira anomala]|nr:hypothetical protein BD770DRAFT_406510 [Pilaira anomala]